MNMKGFVQVFSNFEAWTSCLSWFKAVIARIAQAAQSLYARGHLLSTTGCLTNTYQVHKFHPWGPVKRCEDMMEGYLRRMRLVWVDSLWAAGLLISHSSPFQIGWWESFVLQLTPWPSYATFQKKNKILGVYLYIIEYHRYIDDHRCVSLGDVSGMPKQCDSETFGACQGAACKTRLRFSITTAPWLTSDIQWLGTSWDLWHLLTSIDIFWLSVLKMMVQEIVCWLYWWTQGHHGNGS